jgi:hypothetical protein
VIDPISAFLGNTNEQTNADVRSLLAALAGIARERDIAVIIVSHLRKKEGAAIHRTMGSLAFVAAARAAWVLCQDPTDENKRLLMPIKNNLARSVTGLAYTIDSSPDHRVPILRWCSEPVPATTEAAVGISRAPGRPDDERQHAMDWLQERLKSKGRPARDIKEEADAFGISYGTLRRAFRNLGGEAVRQHKFPFAPWIWKLPGTDAQNPGEEYCAPVALADDLSKLFEQWLPAPATAQNPTRHPTPDT